jgi:ABC-type multidrug transport system, ATPase component
MKKGRSVILTTHAMEEADALSDRIAVIVDGKFKCIGTSLFLKNNFGEGYRYAYIRRN